MKWSAQLLGALAAAAIFLSPAGGETEKLQAIELMPPERAGGKPLMAALQERSSRREFSGKKLPAQTLSNLLWAAFGVNRSESGKRTAPSARNMKEIDIYVALPEGLFLYDGGAHILRPVLKEDIREFTGEQAFTQQAPVNLIYVANRGRMGSLDDGQKDFYSAVDTGFISQNVYLFCSSEGLATVVLGWVDKPALEKKMGLREDQKVILTQPVGYPE
ncbi:MAG: SagB/ThcOx family dehydrogenase [Candidatus Erginobacter occultus]|nr:SagB/ThcOx family dehydrogenase [Candidatus Erginobacter occultus]